MFLSNNLNTSDLDLLRNSVSHGTSSNGNAVGNYYQLQTPFALQFSTYHPDDPTQRLLFTFMSPDKIIYSSSSAEEIEPNLSGGLHQHNFFELLFVVEGTVYQNIENRRHIYTPGSCCLLNKNVRHKEEYSTDFRVIFFQFSEDFIQKLFAALSLNYFEIEQQHVQTQMEQFLQQNIFPSDSMEKNYIDFIPTQNAQWTIQNVHSIFEQITTELLSPQLGSSALITALFFKLFHLLNQSEYYQTTPVRIGTDIENRLFQKITQKMAKTNGRISRSALEKDLHYSGDYLNKIVKKYTGMTIYDYNMTFCMKKAEELLLHSDLPTTEIALQLGFSNRTQFYKVFRNTFSVTPAEYRKLHIHL